jgi:uncharacterized protein YbaR (Trm112 family)
MHIEMTELLRCPADHRDAFLVLATAEMRGRTVERGTVGCPVCGKEFPIRGGVVDFTGAGRREPGAGRSVSAPGSRLPAPDDLRALLDLSSPGGYVVLVGDAVRQAEGLARVLEHVHFAGINGPSDVRATPYLSLLRAEDGIPLRDAFVRGAVVGADALTAQWVSEAVRVVLKGRRIVLAGAPPFPGGAGSAGVETLAAERGIWVGRKT